MHQTASVRFNRTKVSCLKQITCHCQYSSNKKNSAQDATQTVAGMAESVQTFASPSLISKLCLQCFDTVSWATERKSGLYKAGCRFVGGDDLTGALHAVQLQLSPSLPSSLAPIKSSVETFWYWLTPKSTWKTDRERGGVLMEQICGPIFTVFKPFIVCWSCGLVTLHHLKYYGMV